jgi:salicylate hydroxylase
VSDRLRPAIVAGGGIAGLCAALALSRIGIPVEVLERAAVFDEFGAGLQLSPNATGVLRQFNLLDRLAEAALTPQAILIRRGRDGRELARLPLQQAERRWGAPYFVAHRADLHRILLERVAQEALITVTSNISVIDYHQDQDGVTVRSNGNKTAQTVTGRLLLGADGLRSNVRRRLLADGEPRSARRSAWRGLIDASCLAPSLRLPEVNLWLGRHAHLVHYPLRAMSVINVVAVMDDDGRGETGATDAPLPTPGDAPIAFAEPGDGRVLLRQFAGWNPLARSILEAVTLWRKWPLFERDPPQRLSDGRVALVGDAAHPMLPHLAQGAAQAIEDADVLGRAMRDNGDIRSALSSYAQTRHRRVAKICAQAQQLGRLYHLAGPAAMARDIAIQLLGPEQMLARYDWLYRFETT